MTSCPPLQLGVDTSHQELEQLPCPSIYQTKGVHLPGESTNDQSPWQCKGKLYCDKETGKVQLPKTTASVRSRF